MHMKSGSRALAPVPQVTGLLTAEEAAEALKVSPETVMRDWKLARVWLARALEQGRRDA
jgi:predicted DNA-binding protein (UPF0251 family)